MYLTVGLPLAAIALVDYLASSISGLTRHAADAAGAAPDLGATLALFPSRSLSRSTAHQRRG